MGVVTKTVETITCDNAACPGTSGLDPKDRAGWMFVNAEVYGQPGTQTVFCSSECVSAAAGSDPSPLSPPDPPEAPSA